MPHIVLEYSRNLSTTIDASALLDQLHRALGGTESFEADRIKARAIELDNYSIGDKEGGGFMHASVTFSRGRSERARADLGNRLLEILLTEASPSGLEVSRSVEIRQFEPGMYFNDRDHEPVTGELTAQT